MAKCHATWDYRNSKWAAAQAESMCFKRMLDTMRITRLLAIWQELVAASMDPADPTPLEVEALKLKVHVFSF